MQKQTARTVFPTRVKFIKTKIECTFKIGSFRRNCRFLAFFSHLWYTANIYAVLRYSSVKIRRKERYRVRTVIFL